MRVSCALAFLAAAAIAQPSVYCPPYSSPGVGATYDVSKLNNALVDYQWGDDRALTSPRRACAHSRN